MRSHLTTIFLVFSLSLMGQTGNYCAITATGEGIYFDSNFKLKYYSKNVVDQGYGYTKSNYSGELKYNVLGRIMDAGGKNVCKGDVLTSVKSAELELNDSITLVFEDVLEEYIKGKPFRSLRITVLRLRDEKLYVKASEFRQPFLNKNTFGLQTIQDTAGRGWLVVRTASSTFTSYLFSESNIPDNIVYQSFPSLLSPIFDNNAQDAGTNEIYDNIKRSPSGNHLAIFTNYFIRGPVYPIDNWASVNVFQFNKNNGKMKLISEPIRHHDTALYDQSNYTLHSWHNGEFSSNDKYFYFIYQRFQSKTKSDSTFVKRFSLIDFLNEDIYVINNNAGKGTENAQRGGYDLKLTINGELLLLRDGKKNGVWGFYFDVISNSNNIIPTTKTLNYHFPTLNAWNASFAYSKYNYIRVKPKYIYSCHAVVSFDDHCDYSLPNTSIQYFVEFVPGSNKFDLVNANDKLQFQINGNYAYKVVLTSQESNYIEIHYDKLKIRIPERPISNFMVRDSIICAFKSIEFINLTNTIDTNPRNIQKWDWNFGDGSTKTILGAKMNVEHTYIYPGAYTITLFYSNGYCDSTLVKNKYITVITAPKPGFTIDINKGCAPLEVNILDTIQFNTLKKEYYFYDSNNWEELALNKKQFSHKFKQGTYWIVQRLHGISGCVTQKDSIRVYVSPGLTKDDTIKIKASSYLDVFKGTGTYTISDVKGWDKPNAIVLTWLDNRAAFKYQINRNDKLIHLLDKNPNADIQIWTDTLTIQQLYTYEIVGIDSCGSKSSKCKITTPLFLTGKIQGNNEFSTLIFNTYRNFGMNGGKIVYQIQEERGGSWIDLSIQHNNDSYKDFKYVNSEIIGSQGEKCYRIKAFSDSMITLSNVLCLPYLPMIYIPNVFTPNMDELNDYFKPVTYGINSYIVCIFNTWGEMIATFDESSKGWNATNLPEGNYMVSFTGISSKRKVHNINQVVTVLR